VDSRPAPELSRWADTYLWECEMANWFCIHVENTYLPALMDDIIKKFTRFISTTGLSDKAVLLYRYQNENLNTVYFPPGIEDLAKEYSAEICEMPKKDSYLSIIVGSNSCLDQFYPSSDSSNRE